MVRMYVLLQAILLDFTTYCTWGYVYRPFPYIIPVPSMYMYGCIYMYMYIRYTYVCVCTCMYTFLCEKIKCALKNTVQLVIYATQKFVVLAKKGHFECMQILFMRGSTWGVAILRRYKLCKLYLCDFSFTHIIV